MVEKTFKLQTLNLNIKGQSLQYLLIFEGDSLEPHIFSDLFIDNIGQFSLINKSYNTKKNFYGEYIVKFLNYVFNESKNRINNINLLTVDLVEEFLNKYSKRGLISDYKDEWRAAETLNKMNRALKIFIYWLCIKKINNKLLFNMKYIKEKDFKIVEGYQRGVYSRRKDVIKDMFIYETSKVSYTRDKVTTASKYTIFKLVELSQIEDPMLTFGIVLGAFVGLRVGEIVQINKNIIKGFEYSRKGCFLDLRNEWILRSDGKITGHIKRKRKQIIYEGFSMMIKEYYQKHMKFLEENKFNNKYGAIFINNNGYAMMDKGYIRRFKKLIDIYRINVINDAMNGDKNAIKEKEMLDFGPITPHSLRHFYSQYVDELEDGNIFALKLYRGDKSLESQNEYTNVANTERMRSIQERVIREIYSYGESILNE